MLTHPAFEISDRKGLLARYKRLRQIGVHLNHLMVQRLPDQVLKEGVESLGLLDREVLVLDGQDETPILLDYCLYDVRHKGRTMVERYLRENPPDSQSDTMTVLRAMQAAQYSVFIVEAVERRLGVVLRDMRTNEESLVVDIGLGSTAETNLLIATRLMAFDGFAMTTGAALPLGFLRADERKPFSEGLQKVMPAGSDPGPFIKACLDQQASSRVRYRDVTGSTRDLEVAVSGTHQIKPPRNRPCPCGSGRKYKNCCATKSELVQS